jgi:4-hydroxybenzoate polyprenyltransferase
MFGQQPRHERAAGKPQHGFLASISNYFRGWRYRSQAVIGCFALMYLGWITLADPDALGTHGGAALLALLAAIGLVIAIFLINDAADRDIDAIVHPDRPIPAGTADWRHVYVFGLGLIALSVALAAFLGPSFFAAVVATSILVLLYYAYFKRNSPLPCTSELFAPLISAMFPVTAFALVPLTRIDVLCAAAAFIYFADMAQDLLGGIHDEAGDRRFNVRTFAVTLGPHPTRWISAAAFAIALMAGALLWWLGGLNWIYAAVFIIFSLIMLRQYFAVLSSGPAALPIRASHANRLGGTYYFVVSAALFPDYLLGLWLF